MLKKYKTSKKCNLIFSKVDSIHNNIILQFYLNKLSGKGDKVIAEFNLTNKLYIINYLLKYSNILFLFFNLFKILNVSFIFLTRRLYHIAQKIPLLLTFTSSLRLTINSFILLCTLNTSSLFLIKASFLKLIFNLISLANKNILPKSLAPSSKNLLLFKKYINYRW